MRLLSLLSLFLLTACQSAAPTYDVGSFAWMEIVDKKLSISDGQGHGPDYGSQEWCKAAHFKLYGQHAADSVPCDQDWMEGIDKEISKLEM